MDRTGLTDGLDIRGEEKREIQGYNKDFGLSNWVNVVAFSKIGNIEIFPYPLLLHLRKQSPSERKSCEVAQKVRDKWRNLDSFFI